jgi:branched-chain amino acid transport system ATP-binding protein
MTAVLEAQMLSRRFGALAAVSDVTLSIQSGEFRAVIGPNGAGKTTLFNLLSGKITPTAGEIFFRGENVTSLQDSVRCRRGMSRTFQITNIFPELTVRENVRLAIQLKGRGNFQILGGKSRLLATARQAEESLALLGLLERAEVLASILPHGEQRLLEIAMAFAQNPQLLLLDEPTQGLSSEETYAVIKIIRRVARERQLTVLLVEHDMEVVFNLADRISVLNFGRLVAEGTPDEVRKNPDVQKVYLGPV